MSFSQVFNFIDSTNFTFDPTQISLTGGVAALLDRRAQINFATLVNASISTNNLIKTAGAASTFDCKGVSSQAVTSSGGFCSFTYVSNTTNTAAVAGLIKTDTGVSYTDIDFAIEILFPSTIKVIEKGVAVLTTTGNPDDAYSIAISNTGAVTYYKNGALIWTSAKTATFPLYFKGCLEDLNGSINNILICNSATPYSLMNPSIIPNASFSLSSLANFIATTTITGSDAIQYILNIGGQNYWFDGTKWAVSDGQYTQSTSAATILTNIATLPISGIQDIYPIIMLHSATGFSTPSIGKLEMDFNYNAPASNPYVCVVYGWLKDIYGNPLTSANNAKLTVTNSNNFFYGQNIIPPVSESVAADTNGYVELALVETQSAGLGYAFTVTYADPTTKKPVSVSLGTLEVPRTNSASLDTLQKTS